MPPSSTDETPLPDDVAALQAMIRELLATNRAQRQDLANLQTRVDLLLRRLYGPRAERLDPNQPLLFAAQPPPTSVTDTEPAPAQGTPRQRKGHGRQKLPTHLSRQRIVHELTEAERLCPCCQRPRQAVSSQTSEQLDYQPASLFIVEHVRLTYVCTSCQAGVSTPAVAVPQGGNVPNTSTFITAAKPAQPIERGMAGAGLLAYVILSKYGDHLPLHRLEGIFGRHGVQLSRQTLCDWMAACAKLLAPLTGRMAERIRAGRVIHVDDTPVPVLERGRGSTRQGSLWVYVGDEGAPYRVYDFTLGRLQSGPATFLDGFRGYLQADAYNGYDALYKGGQIIEVACWAHARRKFYEARDSDSERAHRMLGWIRQLYAIEKQATEQAQQLHLDQQATWTLRQGLRQEQSVSLLTAMRQWLDVEKGHVLPKSPIGEAISYVLANWEAFTTYTHEGWLQIDNNAAERSLRPLAVGRSNYLFVGSQEGGRTAAVLYSLTQSCRRLGLDTFVYLRELLTSWPEVAEADIDRWLPDVWAQRQREQATGPP
jgi:transposase